jgi:hypothetical protein
MQPLTSADERMANIAKIGESKQKVAFLRRHLKEVIRGAAFQGSHRSGQFLDYIVEKALTGQFESLKERIIGIELFGRPATYDTGEDSIVRVTASDVRKRLLQHYGRYGASSDIRISLPIGSYVPEVTWENHDKAVQLDSAENDQEIASASRDGASLSEPTILSDHPVITPPGLDVVSVSPMARTRRRWLTISILFVTVILAIWGFVWARSARTGDASVSVLPWSEFFATRHSLHLITSDPSIFEIEGFSGSQISVADYANHNYIPDPGKLSPEVKRLCEIILKGDKSASAIDPPIVAEVAALAQSSSRRIDVRAARNIQFSDLKNDDNFIFLGSPSSDPWSGLFSDQLDFRFVFDQNTGQEVIRNAHPRPHELPAYSPTAPGWATGQSYAIIAFVRNPDQGGRVLLIAGMNGEGTEAAGRLVTDLPRLTAVLRQCGLPPSSPPKNFEILLQLNTLAGSSHNIDIPACHILPGSVGP